MYDIMVLGGENMQKLTDEQKKIVEENHNLIYGVAKKFHLNIDDWYGVLAIELCKSVLHHNPERGKLSTYYYMRAGSVILNEITKSKTQKRQHEGMEDLSYLENVETGNTVFENDETIFALRDWFSNEEYGDILKYKLQGYTQREIAELMEMKPHQVKSMLKMAREDYEHVYRR